MCWSDLLCELSQVVSLEDRKTTPAPNQVRFAAYLEEALSLPAVAESISKIYHDYYRKTWGSGDNGIMIVPRVALSSRLGAPLPTENRDYILQAKAGHAPGHIIHGPYWELPAGEYGASVSLEIGDGAAKGEVVCMLDVYNGKEIVIAGDIFADDRSTSRRLKLSFSVAEDDIKRPYEIRLWCAGRLWRHPPVLILNAFALFSQ